MLPTTCTTLTVTCTNRPSPLAGAHAVRSCRAAGKPAPPPRARPPIRARPRDSGRFAFPHPRAASGTVSISASASAHQPPKHMSAMVINAQCRWLWCSRCPRSLHSRPAALRPSDDTPRGTRTHARLRYERKLALGEPPAISSTQGPECCRHGLRDRAAWCARATRDLA